MRGSNPAGPGPIACPRVGKSKKVVKRRGVGVLVFGEEKYLEVEGSREDLDGFGPGTDLGLVLAWCRVDKSDRTVQGRYRVGRSLVYSMGGCRVG